MAKRAPLAALTGLSALSGERAASQPVVPPRGDHLPLPRLLDFGGEALVESSHAHLASGPGGARGRVGLGRETYQPSLDFSRTRGSRALTGRSGLTRSGDRLAGCQPMVRPARSSGGGGGRC